MFNKRGSTSFVVLERKLLLCQLAILLFRQMAIIDDASLQFYMVLECVFSLKEPIRKWSDLGDVSFIRQFSTDSHFKILVSNSIVIFANVVSKLHEQLNEKSFTIIKEMRLRA